MSLAAAMESAVMAHVGIPLGDVIPAAEVTWQDVFQLFDSNADIAQAAGYGAAGDHPVGSPLWTRRKSFMRDLQRYRKRAEGGAGQSREPVRNEPRLVSLGRRQTRRVATIRDVIRLMGMKGTTSDLVKVNFRYSARDREIQARVYTHQSVYREQGWNMRGWRPRTAEEWEQLGEQYLAAFMVAYGIPSEVAGSGVEPNPIISFQIGREEPIDYEYE